MSEMSPENTPRKKPGMFEHPFSFDGRINRTEYALSILICIFIDVAWTLLTSDVALYGVNLFPETILNFAIFWFSLAQGTKRCHDIGKNGWWQLIPFFPLWLLFREGEEGENGYERYE